MNILLINHYAGSPQHGMEYRPFYLAREWVRMGHTVSILASSFSHLRTSGATSNRAITHEKIAGIDYFWFQTPLYQGNGYKRVINIFSFVLQLYTHKSHIMQHTAPDVVIASSTYPLDMLPAHKLANAAQAKLIFEVHDLWPLTLIELAGMSRHHPFIRLLQWAENFAYRHADRVVSMLPKAKHYMVSHGMADAKFTHIPNGIDIDEWQAEQAELPPTHRSLLDELQQANQFVIGYAGGHNISNALDPLLDAAFLLQAMPITFVLVGQGTEKTRLEKLARQKELYNVRFLPPVLKASIPSLLASMDALYIGWQRSSLYRFGISPNKLLDYMMAAKPIIHAVDAGNDPVADSGCGISVAPEDSIAIANAVRQLVNMTPAARVEIGKNGKNYVLARHDYRVLARQFLEILT